MAYMLGEMNRVHQNGYDQFNFEKYVEFHFIIDIDDGYCLDFQEQKE